MAQDEAARRDAEFFKRLEQAREEESRRRERKAEEKRRKKKEEFLLKRRQENDEYQRQFTQQMTTTTAGDGSPTSLYQQFSERRHDFKNASEQRYSSSYDPHSGQRADVRLNRGLGADPTRKVHMNEQVNHRKYDGDAVRVHVRLQSGVGSENSKTVSSPTGGGVKLNRGW